MGDITTSFVKQFNDNVVLLAQQMSERFRSAVRLETGIVGEEAFFEQLASTTAQEKTTRNDDTPLIKSDFRRRRVSMRDWIWADLFDQEDKLKQLIEPTSTVVQNVAAAFARRIDKLVIDEMNGTAATGKTGSTSTVLPAGQKIVHGGTGLTKVKMISAKKLLDAAEVPKEDRFIAVSAEQLEDLLGVTEVTSSDFNTVRALVQGEIDTWLGFKFIHTEQLNVDATPSRLVLAWQKSGVLLATAKEPTTRIEDRADKNFATQVFMSMGIGSTRMEEVKVVEIACNE
jgi:hypothetical protein